MRMRCPNQRRRRCRRRDDAVGSLVLHRNTTLYFLSRHKWKCRFSQPCSKAKLWNALPGNIKEIRSLYTFEIKVKA